jgi:hypothetical protein
MYSLVLASGSGGPQPATSSYNGWLIAAVVALAVMAVGVLVWLALEQRFWWMAAFALAAITIAVLGSYANLPFRQLTQTGRYDRAHTACNHLVAIYGSSDLSAFDKCLALLDSSS